MRIQAVLTILSIAVALGLTACAPTKFKRYHGPEVTRVVVQKAQRRMYLMHNDTVLEAYEIDLGFAPVGPKQFEGDGKTPEGTFFIDRRNPNSEFHLSLGISYPTVADVERARAEGKTAGGDIFIHGGPRPSDRSGHDWTFGCISVSDKQVEQIYAMVRDGTQVDINP